MYSQVYFLASNNQSEKRLPLYKTARKLAVKGKNKPCVLNTNALAHSHAVMMASLGSENKVFRTLNFYSLGCLIFKEHQETN